MENLKSVSRKKFNIKLLSLSFILLFLTAITFIACSNTDEKLNGTSNGIQLREDFLKNKDFETIKTDFNKLTEKEKIALWKEKMEQLLKEKLPTEHKKLIKELKSELEKEKIDVKSISNISINLANITPEDDFYKMFTTLDNYKYKQPFSEKKEVSKDFKKSLISLKFNYEKNISISSKTNIKSCNCKWTCSLYAGGGSKKCTETRSGCGFFWAFECDQRVGPTLEQIQPDTPDLEVETGLN